MPYPLPIRYVPYRSLRDQYIRDLNKDVKRVMQERVFMGRDEVEVHKLAKRERGQYPAILTEQTWSIKDFLYGFWCILLAGYNG